MKNIILESYIKYSDNYDRIKHVLNDANIPHKTKVRFTLYCAESSMLYIDKEKYADAYAKATRCLELIGSWLIDEASVTAKELNAATAASYACASYACASSAASAFAASSSAAYASAFAASSSAAYASAFAAYAASFAAHAAAYASSAASAASAAAAAYAHGGYNEQVYQQHMQKYFYYLIYLLSDDNKFIKLTLGIK